MAQLNSLVVTGNSRFISDVGINATLTVGSSAQNKLPTTGIAIHDIRNIDATPLFLNKSVNFYFTNRSNPYANSPWYSVMHVNGWAGSESYNSWELAGPAHNGDQRTAPLYVRSSNGGTWGSWRKIYDTINPPTYSEVGAAASSHTHNVGQITWAGGQNLITSASANNAEWSLDLTSGTYTGGYFHVWSGKNSKSILMCYNDTNAVTIPSGSLTVSGGKLFATKAINELLTGTGTAAQDKGSGVSPRYFPAKWTMNVGIATPADGDMVTIKIPVAGHDYGVFLSLDNGTTYKPVGLKTQDNGRLTTHFANGKIITLIYDSAAVVDSVYAAAGADARSNITGAWKVVTNYLDGNTDIRAMAYCDTAAGTAAKAASSTNYKLRAKSYVLLNLVNANSSASALTLNINGQGAKNIYINGSVSSSSNYTLPAGTYLVYYNGTNYYFRTDGSITSENGQGIRNATNNGFVTVNAVPDITGDSVNMNWLTQYENAMGMADLRGTDTTVNPNGKTGWHHFINISYKVTGQASNMWQTQIANAAGTTDLWVRSRNGGTIAAGTAWTAPWTRILTGSNYTNVTDGRYLKLAGGTMTGSISCTTSGANLTWGNITIYGGGSDGGKNSMVIGNDAIIGDCNVGGYFGIRPNASGGTNTGIRLFKNDGTMIGGFGSNNGTPKWIDASSAEHQIGFYTATPTSGQVLVADGTGGGLKTSGYTIATSVPSGAVFTDTKNTAGSTDTSSKIFLIGATSQAANPQTYSDNEVYATSGVLTTKSVQVGGTAATMQYNSTNHCIDFIVT